jgi:hypothetical protein
MSNRSHATTTVLVTAWSERSGWRWWWRRGRSVSLSLDVSGGDKAGVDRAGERGRSDGGVARRVVVLQKKD